MIRHYVELYYPGSFLSETEIIELKSRDDEFYIPRGCYGYYFFDVKEVNVGGEKLVGKPKNKSPFFFFGKKYTLEEVIQKFPEKKILINNMKYNDYKEIVLTRCGNWQPFDKDDILIEE